METIVTFLNDYIGIQGGETATPQELVDARDDLENEINRGKAKAAANRQVYEDAHDVIVSALPTASAPVSVQELFDAIESELPEGFSKGKVQYALNHFWESEVGKAPLGKSNGYYRK